MYTQMAVVYEEHKRQRKYIINIRKHLVKHSEPDKATLALPDTTSDNPNTAKQSIHVVSMIKAFEGNASVYDTSYEVS